MPRKKTARKSTTGSSRKRMAQKTGRPDFNARALELHKKLRGKLSVVAKRALRTRVDWSTMYTPGVGAVASHVAGRPKDARTYTMKGNTVAVISDGSAVLGLGNIGPLGALPVMEGKCAIFKEMADVDAFPIVLDTQDVDEVVATITHIAPGFGGINLEDFAAPKCFEIESRLKEELDIPVMHDDQHGTAIVVLAGLINASKVVRKNLKKMRVVVVGAGAAGHAIALLLVKYGITDLVVVDRAGAIHAGRRGLSGHKKQLATVTNSAGRTGELEDVIDGADVLIGVSGAGRISRAHVEAMAEKSIVFALANPVPEILPKDAKAAGAHIIATGRSDFPNQVNNSLAFPGIFRGALDNNVRMITDDMKLKAAQKVASLVKRPTADCIIPSVMEAGLVKAVASVIR